MFTLATRSAFSPDLMLMYTSAQGALFFKTLACPCNSDFWSCDDTLAQMASFLCSAMLRMRLFMFDAEPASLRLTITGRAQALDFGRGVSELKADQMY
jgi:hypothetical protein